MVRSIEASSRRRSRSRRSTSALSGRCSSRAPRSRRLSESRALEERRLTRAGAAARGRADRVQSEEDWVECQLEHDPVSLVASVRLGPRGGGGHGTKLWGPSEVGTGGRIRRCCAVASGSVGGGWRTMAQVLGLGGVFFLSRTPRRLARWHRDCLGVPLEMPSAASFKPADTPANSSTVWSVLPSRATTSVHPRGRSWSTSWSTMSTRHCARSSWLVRPLQPSSGIGPTAE